MTEISTSDIRIQTVERSCHFEETTFKQRKDGCHKDGRTCILEVSPYLFLYSFSKWVHASTQSSAMDQDHSL